MPNAEIQQHAHRHRQTAINYNCLVYHTVIKPKLAPKIKKTPATLTTSSNSLGTETRIKSLSDALRHSKNGLRRAAFSRPFCSFRIAIILSLFCATRVLCVVLAQVVFHEHYILDHLIRIWQNNWEAQQFNLMKFSSLCFCFFLISAAFKSKQFGRFIIFSLDRGSGERFGW